MDEMYISYILCNKFIAFLVNAIKNILAVIY